MRSVSNVEPVPAAAQERINAYLHEQEGESRPFVPFELLQEWHDELVK
jgi:hypothetical protein